MSALRFSGKLLKCVWYQWWDCLCGIKLAAVQTARRRRTPRVQRIRGLLPARSFTGKPWSWNQRMVSAMVSGRGRGR